MKVDKSECSEQEQHEAAVELLGQLREKLHSGNISIARKAAFGLSWMQEDGLDILKAALFGNFPRTTKKAAAYGLRSMKGRMKKMASEVLAEGLKHRNRTTQAACEKSLLLMAGKRPQKARPQQSASGRPRIREIRSGRRARPRSRQRPF